MIMFKNYFARRDAFSGLTEKVVGFLHIYLNHAPQDASEFVKTHRPLLTMYYKAQANSPALTEMSKIIKLDSDTASEDVNDETTTVLVTGKYIGGNFRLLPFFLKRALRYRAFESIRH